ncbi:MAG: hypothetical protein IPL40_04140 [Proteobacteria bacterium]|nr:hypothetical protein [Pseudomonadota bacterium]
MSRFRDAGATWPRLGWPRWWAAATLTVVGACYNPQLVGPGLFLCPDEKCPDGFVCNAQQRCERVEDDEGADQGGGGRRDGGADGGGEEGALACTAEAPALVTQFNESAIGMIGLVSDDNGALAVSYPAAIFDGARERSRELVIARRPSVSAGDGAPTVAWTRANQPVFALTNQSVGLYYSALDTRAGQLAVAFNASAGGTNGNQAPLTLWTGPANATSAQAGRITELSGEFTGGPVFTGAAPAVAIAQTADNRTYAVVAGQALPEAASSAPSSVLVVVDPASGVRKAMIPLPPPARAASESQVTASDLAQRLLFTAATTPRQIFLGQLGELLPRGASAPPVGSLQATLLFVSQLDLDGLLGSDGPRPTVSWFTEPQLTVRGFATVPLALTPSGPGVVFPARGSSAGVDGSGLYEQSLPPKGAPQALRAGASAIPNAIRPAVSSRDGFTGVAFIAFEGDLARAGEAAATGMFGQVCFTAATKQREGQWTRSLCLPGTEGDNGAYQVEVVASSTTGGRSVFELVYWHRQPLGGSNLTSLRVSHTRVVCRPLL